MRAQNVHRNCAFNKALKPDCKRAAILVQIGFMVVILGLVERLLAT